jgi:hypothetical protein
MYWYIIPVFLIGLLTWWKSPQKSIEQKIYSSIFLAVSAYLILYYGSWLVSDTPDKSAISLGLSYNRYWLPIFLLGMPYVVYGSEAVATWLSKQHAALVKAVLLAVLLLIFVIQAGLTDRESVRFMIENGVEYRGVQDWVLDQTPANAVILTTRHDKILWPQRQVVVMSDDIHELERPLNVLLQQAPLYWLTEFPSSQVQELEQRNLATQQIKLNLIGKHQTFFLYGLAPHTQP